VSPFLHSSAQRDTFNIPAPPPPPPPHRFLSCTHVNIVFSVGSLSPKNPLISRLLFTLALKLPPLPPTYNPLLSNVVLVPSLLRIMPASPCVNGDCHRSYHSHDNLTTGPRHFNIPQVRRQVADMVFPALHRILDPKRDFAVFRRLPGGQARSCEDAAHLQPLSGCRRDVT
jgi:hypothetical protein